MRRHFKIVLAVLVAGLVLWGYYAGRLLVVAIPVGEADAIVSLASHEWERLPAAAAAAARFPKALVILTLPTRVTIRNCHDCPNRVARLVRAGVAADRIRVLPLTAEGTLGEARACAEFTRRAGLRSVLVVTSAYHTRRALAVFRHELTGAWRGHRHRAGVQVLRRAAVTLVDVGVRSLVCDVRVGRIDLLRDLAPCAAGVRRQRAAGLARSSVAAAGANLSYSSGGDIWRYFCSPLLDGRDWHRRRPAKRRGGSLPRRTRPGFQRRRTPVARKGSRPRSWTAPRSRRGLRPRADPGRERRGGIRHRRVRHQAAHGGHSCRASRRSRGHRVCLLAVPARRGPCMRLSTGARSVALDRRRRRRGGGRFPMARSRLCDGVLRRNRGLRLRAALRRASSRGAGKARRRGGAKDLAGTLHLPR